MIKRIIFTAVLWVFTSTVFAQNLYQIPSHWDNFVIRNLGVDDGITSQQIYNIHQDEDGFIWIVSNRQLLRYDGLKFRAFDKGNIGGTLYGLIEDSDGTMWIPSIGAGLYSFNGDSLKSYSSSSGDLVKAIEIRNDTLYLGMYGDGLKLFYQDSVIAHYTDDDGLVGDEVWTIEKDSSGNFWIGTNSGLSYFDGKTFTNFTTENGLPYNNIRSIEVLENGEVWVGTDKEGIVVFEGLIPTKYFNEQNGLQSGIITSITQLSDNSIIVGSLGGGAMLYNGENFDAINLESGLISNNVNTSFESESGTIFLGTEDGLSVLVPRLFNSITLDNQSIFREEAVTLTQDGNDRFWIGMYGLGYRYLENDGWKSIENPPFVTNGYAQSSTIDSDGNLWVGTQGSGVFKFDGSNFVSKYTTENGLLDNYTRGITFDFDGNLWVGSNKGISVYSQSEELITTYSTSDEIPNPFCITLTTASDGSVWYGSFGGGVVKFKDGEKTIYNSSKGLRSDQVLSIFEDSNSDIWIGTFNYGISKVVGDSLTTFGPNDGLPEGANVAGILEDDDQNLWLATGNGVIKVSLSEFNNFEAGNIEQINIHYYTTEDGLISDNLQAANNSTVLKHKDGALFFASIDGISYINPNEKMSFTSSVSPYIEEILVDGEPISDFDEFELTPDQNKLEISFSAINFETPRKTKFRVKLEGVDEDWEYMNNRTTTYYDFLPEGDFTFTVSAIGQDGQWSSNTASINFSVLPPFYKTWWFISLCLIGFGGIIAGGIRIYYRAKVVALNRELAYQQKIHKERERISRDLHDNVGSQITNLITGLEISQLHFQKNETDKAIDLISDLDTDARSAMTELRETIWLMDKDEIPASVFIDHLRGYVRRQSRYLPDTKTEVKSSDSLEKILKPAESLNLMRIIQEALNNTKKYARANFFTISFQQTNGRLAIQIEDDGIGMDVVSAENMGNGIGNIKYRAQEIDAEIAIKSELKKGTTISIHL